MAEDGRDRLKKPLRLEARTGFSDRAAVGGLERYVERWAADAALRAPSALREAGPRLRESFRGYGRLDPDRRRAVVLGALALLDTAAHGPPAPPRASPARAAAIERWRPEPVTAVRGVGAKMAGRLEKLGIRTVEDLLRYRPRAWQDRSRIVEIRRAPLAEPVAVRGQVVRSLVDGHPRLRWADVLLRDGTGELRLLFFGQPYRARQFRTGDLVVASGVIEYDRGERRMRNAEYEVLSPDGEREAFARPVAPLYPLTEGVTQAQMRRLVEDVLARFGRAVPDWLPPAIRSGARLAPLAAAYARMHFPPRAGDERAALDRVAFDDLFLLELAVAVRRREIGTAPGISFATDVPARRRFEAALPFPLTGAQRRVLSEMDSDLARAHPMNRLLQGDVGSGKTVVAAACAATAAGNGYQTAVMAPTEILAQQHFQTFERLLSPAGIGVVRVTGGQSRRDRAAALDQLRSGEAGVGVGTHALLSDPTDFARLGLVVVDEQHRFGVLQRARLRAKADFPDVVVMTATPIPRTLAMTLYGDLDVSTLDELPPGRTPVRTVVVPGRDRARLVQALLSELSAGRQAYLVCPLIEESPRLALRAAVAMHGRWREALAPHRVELLHGRLRPAEKRRVMDAFARGEAAALVSTTVIEVGVDVPNATVMVVEDAERFGLSALHQLRGRVGRGASPSACYLVASDSAGRASRRLRVLAATNDGFRIAEADLELRGPGELFGTRQHGDEALFPLPRSFSRGFGLRVVAPARNAAAALLSADPALARPEHAEVRRRFLARYGPVLPLASVG